MIDTHCHLSDPQFNKDLNLVLQRAQQKGISKIINAGYDIKTSQIVVDMAQKNKWLLPAVGIHPNELAADSLTQFSRIEELIINNRIYAIGETGLDFYRVKSATQAQQELFRVHIRSAKKYNLPLLIHTRNSIEEAIRILLEEDYHCGVFHCYSGTYEQAQKILDLGFYLGFGGILTFSQRLRELFKLIPISRIVLETDAPFLAPAGNRGQRNEPSYIFETLHSAANIIDVKAEELEAILDKNASQLFSI